MSLKVARPEVIDEPTTDQQQVLTDLQDLRLEMKVKNNVLWHAIFGQYKSVRALCMAHKDLKSHGTTISDLLRFKVSPLQKEAAGWNKTRVVRG